MEEGDKTDHTTGKKLQEDFDQVYENAKDNSLKMRPAFDARLGGKILGIITAILAGLSALGCVGGFVYVNVVTSMGQNFDGVRRQDDNETVLYGWEVKNVLLMNSAITLGFIIALMEFCLAIILAHGAANAKADSLYACYIYWSMKTSLLFIASMIVFTVIWYKVPGSLVLLSSAVKGALTVLVYLAYKYVKTSKDHFTDEVLIQETKAPAGEKKTYNFDARTVTLGISIIISVISGILVVSCIPGIIYLIIITVMGYDVDGVLHIQGSYYEPTFATEDVTKLLVVNGVVTTVLVSALTELCFSVALVIGLFKKNNATLTAYVIYGLIKTAIIFLFGVTMCALTSHSLMIGKMTLLVWVLNLLWVGAVYMTSKKLQQERSFFSEFHNGKLIQN